MEILTENTQNSHIAAKGTETSVKSRQPGLSDTFIVAPWRVEPQLNTLSHTQHQETRHLEPRLMRLLCYLAANGEAVLSRDELVQELWPKVIVNENSLTRAVSELRKQLDSAEAAGSQFIQTIPKRGYRLCKPVQNPAAVAISAADQADQQGPLQHRESTTAATSSVTRDWRIQAGMVAACLTLVVGLWNPAGSAIPTSGQESALAPVALASNPAQATGQSQASIPAPSPLSDQIVPSPSWPNKNQIALSANTEDSRKFAGIDTPVMSADKERFAYIKRDLTGSTVYVGSTNEETAPVAVFNCARYLSNLTWSPLGNSLLFASHADMTPAAMFGNAVANNATLLSLDLDTMEVSELIEQAPANETESSPTVNLTWLQPAAFTPSKHSSGLPG